jgi:signal transduction histidine kinase
MILRHFGESLTDQQRKLLEEAEKSNGAVAKLLADLSDLAHIEDGRSVVRRQPVPIFDLLSEVASTVHADTDRGVTLEVRCTSPGARVHGDAERLRPVLDSLLTAVLRERVEPGVVLACCGLVADGGAPEAVIAIGDAETAPALASRRPEEGSFDQYRGGLGFRLPLAAAVVAAHGGRLVSPIEHRGRLTIVLSLPVVTESENTA